MFVVLQICNHYIKTKSQGPKYWYVYTHSRSHTYVFLANMYYPTIKQQSAFNSSLFISKFVV